MKRTAFTIVELLAVVGIVALLVAMLLPALSGARAKALSVACQSNLRQLNVAFAQYAIDYRGAVPPIVGVGHPGWDYYWKFVENSRYLGSGEVYGGAANGLRYAILSCPAERDGVCISQPTTEAPRRMFDNPWVPTSYTMNWVMTNGGNKAKFGQRTRDGSVYWGGGSVYRKYQASDVGFMMDGPLYNWGWATVDYEWNVDAPFSGYPHGFRYFHAFRHPDRSANMLYLDGHVGSVFHYTRTGRYLFNFKYP